ncbi:MAG: UDP-glucose 4-epimerase GalE [Vicinamibacterales bacterium]|nr:UDP-glucose 4-epimerase GalE [Acidobacteriota bacterium]MDP7295682.1 UDP-glucose 4-epimerase GalE [Vicinamibacterales bacterium]MDP7472194.1 UDP-glucose 4-epimerase GalE [Vicinamibacterales bacterium]MDP7672515.1 UDP-glucose 4-epimerase GalE [Vicinamibacterales bacterium]HJO37146.1 UDP-glucose 4-epimerase GalE [Vicinamibacterales bacterium]
MSSILVAGGAGYIGSHASQALRDAGHDVVCYDNLSTGHREALLGGTFVEGDIRDIDLVRRTLRQHRVTAVMHFAALLSVPESVVDPVGYYRNNVTGTLALLEAMVAESVGAFVFSSTAAVYGTPERMPMTEEHPTWPVNTYGETKLAIERALPHYERAYGVRAVSLRYFNASGADPAGRLGEAHHPETHLIPRALTAVTGGPPLDIFGDDYPTPDGTCVRDFIHVTDLADAHVRALNWIDDGGASGSYNVGTGRGESVQKVVETVAGVTGRPVPTAVGPRRTGDPSALVAASDRIQRELAWTPSHSDLKEIVESAWRWHQSGWRGAAGGAG